MSQGTLFSLFNVGDVLGFTGRILSDVLVFIVKHWNFKVKDSSTKKTCNLFQSHKFFQPLVSGVRMLLKYNNGNPLSKNH